MPQRIDGSGPSRPAAPRSRSTFRASTPTPGPERHGPGRDDAERVRGEARRTRRRVAAALGALLAVAVGLSVLLATPPPGAAPGHAAARPANQATTSPARSAASTAPSAGPFTAPARWIELPPASGAAAQMPTGFARTTAGAAAFAVQVVQFAWSASYDQVQRAAALYASRADPSAQSDAVAFAAQLRALAGIPASGLPPAGSGVSAHVVGLAVNDTADGTSIDLLVEVTAAPGPGRPSQTLTVATSVHAVWDAGASDWRYSAASLPCSRAADELGTAGFNTAGWSALQPAAP